MSTPLLGALRRKNLRNIESNLLDIALTELTLPERIVRLDFAVLVENDGHVRVLGDFVFRRTLRVVNGKNDVIKLFVFGQGLQLSFQPFFIAAEDDKAAHLARTVLGGSSINFLDQTGRGVADLACEDHCDRV